MSATDAVRRRRPRPRAKIIHDPVGESALLKTTLRALGLTFDETESIRETETATLYLAEAATEPARELLEKAQRGELEIEESPE